MLWQIDPNHATVDFSVKHMAIATVRGSFNIFSASGETDDQDFPKSLTMEIDATSVTTNNAQRDAHLRSADFFDVENHPKLTFRSTSIRGTRGELIIEGELTIRGVTKLVTLTGELSQVVTDPWGNKRTSIEVSGRISREQFGLLWNQALEFGGVMVSDEVKMRIEAEAIAAAPVGA